MTERRGLQKATVLAENLPPVSILYDGSIGYYVRYRIASKDRNRISHWSPTRIIKIPDFVYIGKVDMSQTDNSVTAVWGDEYNRPKYDVFVRWGVEATKLQITANSPTSTVRIEVNDRTNFPVGTQIVVAVDSQQTLVNGTFTISASYDNNSKHYIEYQIAGVNNTQSEITVSGEVTTIYEYHGTTSVHSYSFLKLPNYSIVHVDIQVDSIEKIHAEEQLVIYDSDPYTIT